MQSGVELETRWGTRSPSRELGTYGWRVEEEEGRGEAGIFRWEYKYATTWLRGPPHFNLVESYILHRGDAGSNISQSPSSMTYPRMRRQSTKSRGVLEPKNFDRGPFRTWYGCIFSAHCVIADEFTRTGHGHIVGHRSFYSTVLLLGRIRSRSG
jgi:hypothetical protein